MSPEPFVSRAKAPVGYEERKGLWGREWAVKAQKPGTGSKDAKRSMEQEFSFGTSQPGKFRDYLIKSNKDFKLSTLKVVAVDSPQFSLALRNQDGGPS